MDALDKRPRRAARPQKQPEDVRTFFDALRKNDCFYVAPLGANDDWCAGEAVVREQHRHAP